MTEVRVHPEGEAEVAQAATWYSERSKVAARRFLDAVEEAIERMVQLPDGFPLVPVPGSPLVLRRVLLRRFPYALIFAKTSLRLEVLAIAHMKRRPLYWVLRIADVEDEP